MSVREDRKSDKNSIRSSALCPYLSIVIERKEKSSCTAFLFSLFRVSFLFFSISLTSCSTLPATHFQEDMHTIRGVPFYPQEVNECGPAALAAVLEYLGVAVTPDQIAEDIFSKNARGTLTLDMELYAERKGMEAQQYKGSLDDLKKKIDAQIPLIVLVDQGIYPLKRYHFMVITGYSKYAVIAHSGKHEQKFIAKEDFLKAWRKTNYWTLQIKRGTGDDSF